MRSLKGPSAHSAKCQKPSYNQRSEDRSRDTPITAGDEDDPEYREEMFKSFEYDKVNPDHIRDKKMRADYVKWLEATGRKR